MNQKLLTWPEAAVELKWEPADAPDAKLEAAGRRLRDAVMAAEKQQGKRIATRLRGQKHPKTRVTMGALDRHMPELRRTRADQLADNFKQYLADMDERIDERAAKAVQRLVQPQIRELHGKANQAQSDATTALERIDELGKRLAKRRTG